MPRLVSNGARLSGSQARAFRDALISGYSAPGPFGQMLRYECNQRLANLSLANTMPQIAFEVIETAEDQGWTLELLAGARRGNAGNSELFAFAQEFGLAPRIYEQINESKAPVQPIDALRLEKLVNESNGLKNILQWRTTLGTLEGQVCRIEIPAGMTPETGTGFLVGTRTVLTNYHVMQLVKEQLVDPAQVILRFDFKQNLDGVTVDRGTEYRLANDWLIDYSPVSPQDFAGNEPRADELDYALLHLAGNPGKDPIGGPMAQNPDALPRGWIKIPTNPLPFKPNTALFILQHPKGQPMKLALDTSAIIEEKFNGRRVRYRTNTEAGSSGSPCFDDNWNLVALHHLGDPGFNPDNKPLFNQGIPIKTIVNLLKRRGKAGEIGV